MKPTSTPSNGAAISQASILKSVGAIVKKKSQPSGQTPREDKKEGNLAGK